ncbi:MAG: SLBB domain-containing protein [Oscillospiraceae bacterium]|nr:SLBB domain-containing protein [Oscillospiraceae bacterium]
MDREEIINKIREAGVVGAGGAGFPTHAKVNCQAEVVIANGAECEPLLRVDQQVMALFAKQLIRGLQAEMECCGAKEGVILLKDHYHDAIAALQAELKFLRNIRLHVIKSYYPAGDEQQIIYEVTGRVVPTGGLPKDAGAVVQNVSTLVNVANALEDQPVTDKFVTVGGAVNNPVTVCAPIGTSVKALLNAAGGVVGDCAIIIGGPCMGAVAADINIPITKTTGGILAIPKEHPLLQKKSAEINMKVMQSVCCQCSMCTQMCPRNALGLHVQPHKAMRAVANGEDLFGDVNGIFSCCDCGVCTYFACNFGLKPSAIMKRVKGQLAASGVKPRVEAKYPPDRFIEDKRIPTERLITRLGVGQYDVEAPMAPGIYPAKVVRINLKQHIGAPSKPVVEQGDMVKRGQLIAQIPEKALGANIHASIDGRVSEVTEQYIELKVVANEHAAGAGNA